MPHADAVVMERMAAIGTAQHRFITAIVTRAAHGAHIDSEQMCHHRRRARHVHDNLVACFDVSANERREQGRNNSENRQQLRTVQYFRADSGVDKLCIYHDSFSGKRISCK